MLMDKEFKLSKSNRQVMSCILHKTSNDKHTTCTEDKCAKYNFHMSFSYAL